MTWCSLHRKTVSYSFVGVVASVTYQRWSMPPGELVMITCVVHMVYKDVAATHVRRFAPVKWLHGIRLPHRLPCALSMNLLMPYYHYYFLLALLLHLSNSTFVAFQHDVVVHVLLLLVYLLLQTYCAIQSFTPSQLAFIEYHTAVTPTHTT